MRNYGASSITATPQSDSSESQTTPPETVTEEEIITTTTETEPPVEAKPLLVNPVPEHEAADESYFDSCVFVGDSISTGLFNYGFLESEQVIASIGMNIQKINTDKIKTAYGEMTVIEALKEANPENLYVMLGSNGIFWLSTDFMISRYEQFIEEALEELPDVNVYILSIPPVTESRENDEDEPISNSDIDSYNSALLELANKYGVNFVDLNTGLKNNDGKLSEEEAEPDGMHFKVGTYEKMLDYILKHTVSEEYFTYETAPVSESADPSSEAETSAETDRAA